MRHNSDTQINVRDLYVADRLTWKELWADYNAFYGRTGETALAPEVVDTTWTRLLDGTVPIHGFLAMRDSTPIGLAHVVFHHNLIQHEPTCYLQDLFTRPEARGTGVARALIEAVCDLCRTKGVNDVYWHTHKSNDVARQLYGRIAQNTEFLVYRIKPLTA